MRRLAFSLTTVALLVSGLVTGVASAGPGEPLQPPEPSDGLGSILWCHDRGFILMVIGDALYCVYVDEITVTG